MFDFENGTTKCRRKCTSESGHKHLSLTNRGLMWNGIKEAACCVRNDTREATLVTTALNCFCITRPYTTSLHPRPVQHQDKTG